MFTLTLGFLAPIVLAILLQEVSHGKIVYRTLYYLPAVMSGLVVIFMWKLFYQAGSSGILNQTLNSLASLCGLEFTPQDWLNDAKWAMLACVIPTIWAGAGPGCLIYLAALKGVPEETYEAAEIDGANFFQKIWHVTFPTLKALIIINFVGAFIASAQSGGMILIMTFGRANHGGRRTAYLQGSLHESSVWKRHFNGVGAGNDDVDVHHLQSQETFQNGIQDNGEITWLS